MPYSLPACCENGSDRHPGPPGLSVEASAEATTLDRHLIVYLLPAVAIL
jgi:hypothetical protein